MISMAGTSTSENLASDPNRAASDSPRAYPAGAVPWGTFGTRYIARADQPKAIAKGTSIRHGISALLGTELLGIAPSPKTTGRTSPPTIPMAKDDR